MNKIKNQQYQETHRKLHQTYLKLLAISPRVGVSKLCEAANINRATFYYHFIDIIDLHETLKQDIFSELYLEFTQSKQESRFISLEIYQIFTKHLYKYRHFYALFLDENIASFPIADGYSTLRDDFIVPRLNKKGITDDAIIDLRFICFQAGLTHTLKAWFDGGLVHPPEAVAEVLFDTLTL